MPKTFSVSSFRSQDVLGRSPSFERFSEKPLPFSRTPRPKSWMICVPSLTPILRSTAGAVGADNPGKVVPVVRFDFNPLGMPSLPTQ